MRPLGRSPRLRGAIAVALLSAIAAAGFRLARGARLERAEFAFTNGGELTSLDPHAVSGIPEGRIVRALFEGLVARDPKTLAVVPGAAQNWECSQDGLVHRFLLRTDAAWSNGDPLTAQDFEWSLRRLLEPETASPNAAQLWLVDGAREFSTAPAGERDWTRVGIRALDPRRLEIRLTAPAPHFLSLLASYPFVPVHRASLEALRARFPRTWSIEWTRPEHLVCNGPYRLLERRIHDRIRLVRNERYWDASKVGFGSIDALAVESATTALNLYLTGAVDWVDGSIPTSAVPELLGRADFKVAPYHGLYFYRLNTTRPPFDDARVRRALSLALNRREICELVLKAGQQPALSFVPWGFIAGYQGPRLPDENADEARALLAECGYGPQGRPFPRIEIHYNTREDHRDIAEVVAARWQSELGIEVRLSNQEWKVFLDAQKNLDYQVSRSSWIADYEDASTFLDIWRSDSENNRTGWRSERYDDLVARAAVELDYATRNELHREAETLLLEELPAIPLYAYVSQNLVSPALEGFHPNPLNEFFPKAWRWKNGAKLDQERAARMRVPNAKDAEQAKPVVQPPTPKPPPTKQGR